MGRNEEEPVLSVFSQAHGSNRGAYRGSRDRICFPLAFLTIVNRYALYRLYRLNVAAHAADASREVVERWLLDGRITCNPLLRIPPKRKWSVERLCP